MVAPKVWARLGKPAFQTSVGWGEPWGECHPGICWTVESPARGFLPWVAPPACSFGWWLVAGASLF
jgi:hypothetical protein